jgi:6-phosphogluconolactonase (cycloisomerase 2 family)
MWAHGNILVASFQDGSIGSFNISTGTPVANGDLQLSTGYLQDGSFPEGVDITADGHYALFGGTNSPELVEVSDISSGKLTPTVVYSNVGSGSGSEAIWLSPDETLLYTSSFSSSQVTAAHFDKTTGAVASGCISGTLRGFDFEAGLATASNSGTGGALYVAEPDTNIGIVNITESGGTCTLKESPKSPISDSNTITVESVGVFPPRPF